MVATGPTFNMRTGMRLISYHSPSGPRLGALKDDGYVDLQDAATAVGRDLPADMRGFIETGETGLDSADLAIREATPLPLAGVRLAPPIPDPRKNVFCVGRNYQDHIEEGARARAAAVVVPEHVVFFTKPPTAVIGHGDDIRWDPTVTQMLDWEVELVVVIGRRGRDIPRDRAAAHVFGYTVGVDVSARDLQAAHTQWFKGKGLDTSCPLGPCIVPRRDLPDVADASISLRINGQLRQDSRTSRMMFDVPTIIEQLSAGLTLEPGDMIMTGTPSGTGHGMTPPTFLQGGDVIEAAIEGVGVLRNRVVRAAPSDA
jgi:2-keto-4-pentenoate hydratase/2-oxohepta-3-ene-1,7-dioic acid hydratase in catechol pathway